MASIDCWRYSRSIQGATSGHEEDDQEDILLQQDYAAIVPFEIDVQQEQQLGQQQQQQGLMNRWKQVLRSAFSVNSSSSSDHHRRRKAAWNAVVESLMHRHPGSQLPERLISMIRHHFDSLPPSYSQAGFTCDQVFLHIRLIEQARGSDEAMALSIEQGSRSQSGRSSNASESSMASTSTWEDDQEEDVCGLPQVVAFATHAMSISKRSICWAFKRSGMPVKRVQIFDRKPVLLGLVALQQQHQQQISSSSRDLIHRHEPERIQSILRAAAKRSRLITITLGLHQHQHQARHRLTVSSSDVAAAAAPDEDHRLSFACSDINFSPDEDLAPWMLDLHKLEMIDERVARYGNDLVTVELVDQGGELRKDVLALCSTSETLLQRNVIPIRGICCDRQKRWAIYKHLRRSTTLFDLLKNRVKLEIDRLVSIARDVAQGMKFLHDNGIIHSDLTTRRIVLDEQGVALVGGLKLAEAESWPAPEPADDVHSFGFVIWELMACGYEHQAPKPRDEQTNPVVACANPRDQHKMDRLALVMHQCWAPEPLERPGFCNILQLLNARIECACASECSSAVN